jgi:hypothetical protein
MSIPTISSGKNNYYDLGPTRKYDIDIICKALFHYENLMSTKVHGAEPGSDERFFLASERNAARELVERYSKPLPLYE